MFLPYPSGLIRDGRASGYRLLDPGMSGILSVKMQCIATIFGCGGRMTVDIPMLHKITRCTGIRKLTTLFEKISVFAVAV